MSTLEETAIKVRNLTFTYHESKEPAVKDLNFSVKKGSWFAIIGKNGSGKSTVTRLLNGLLLPDSNESSSIIIDGEKLNEDNVWDIRKKIGIVFQNPDNQFVGATVADDVAFGLENRGIPRKEMIEKVNQSLKEVGMLEYKDSEPSNLSGGQKQRVAIAGILAIEPQILILDESTSMLDPQGKEDIIKLVRKMQCEKKLTIISITHDIEEAERADEILVLKDGRKIIQGTANEVFNQSSIIENAGLKLPLVFDLKKKLSAAGIEIPETITTENELSKYLCQLNSKM